MSSNQLSVISHWQLITDYCSLSPPLCHSQNRFYAKAPSQQLAFFPSADPEALAETLTAFANSEGGLVVLGIDADGHLGDIFVAEEAQEALQAALRLCRPPVRTEWDQEQVAGGVVVLLTRRAEQQCAYVVGWPTFGAERHRESSVRRHRDRPTDGESSIEQLRSTGGRGRHA